MTLFEYYGYEYLKPEIMQELDNCNNYYTHQFSFDSIYDENSSQQYVYENSAKPAVLSILQGFNSTIMAYGQTGTGKTFTMEGNFIENSNRGILPRSVDEIFKYMETQRNKFSFAMKVSYLQIYNETIQDLLTTDKSNLMIYIYGNIDIKSIPKFNKINHLFDNKDFTFPIVKFKKILNIEHPNQEENNHSITILYHCGEFYPSRNIYLILLSIITENLFYTEMRTKQQLGYVVQMNNDKLNNNFYLYQFIQSDKDCDYLEKKINEFNNKLKSKLNKINITKWVNTLKNHLEEKENTTYDLFNKYNNQILSRQFLFTKNQLLLNQLENITLKSLIEFADTYLFNNTNKTVIKVNKKN